MGSAHPLWEYKWKYPSINAIVQNAFSANKTFFRNVCHVLESSICRISQKETPKKSNDSEYKRVQKMSLYSEIKND